MSRIDEVRAAMVEAMKAKDKQRKDALSMLLAALNNFEIDKKDHTPITEEESDAVVKRKSSRLRKPLSLLRRTGKTSGRKRRSASRFIRNSPLRT